MDSAPPPARAIRPETWTAMRLRPLLTEWQREQSWPDVRVGLVHFIVDVCRCLQLPARDVRWLLAEEGWEFFVDSQELAIGLGPAPGEE